MSLRITPPRQSPVHSSTESYHSTTKSGASSATDSPRSLEESGSISSGYESSDDSGRLVEGEPLVPLSPRTPRLPRGVIDSAAVLPEPGEAPRFEALCDELGIAAADRGAFRELFEQFTASSQRAQTPQEQAAIQEINGRIAQAARIVAPDVGRLAQAKNSFKTGLIAWTTGFGAVSALVKTIGYTPLGKSAVHFVMLAGPVLLLIGEVLAGRYRAQGPGYAAADNGAYLRYSTLVSQHKELQMRIGAFRDVGRADDASRLEAKAEGLRTAVQGLCMDAIDRELGQAMGRKEHPDVPDGALMRCLRSGLTADESGKVCLPDGAELFTVHPIQTPGSCKVSWPDGTETDLRREPVPPACADAFAQAEDLLLGATRARSFVCDELPFLLYGGCYVIAGNFGPLLLAQGRPAADFMLSQAMTFAGVQCLMHAQNGMRSWLGGLPPTAGISTEVRLGRRELQELLVTSAKARVEVLAQRREALRAQRRQIRADQAAGVVEVGAAGREIAALDQQIGEISTRLHEERREFGRAKIQRQLAGQKLQVTGRGWLDSMKTYVADNRTLMVSKLIGYTATYVFYSQVYIPAIGPLMPGHAPASDFNATMTGDMSAAPGDFSTLDDYRTAFSFFGFVMAVPFMFRNNPMTRLAEYGIHFATGAGRAGIDRLRRGPWVEEVVEDMDDEIPPNDDPEILIDDDSKTPDNSSVEDSTSPYGSSDDDRN